MAADPVKDVTDHLDSNTTALTVGTNLFYGPVRAVSSAMPARAVFVVGVGGAPAQRVTGTALEVREASLQVRVRSTSFSDGLSLARTVYTTLESATPTNYLDVVARQSEPIFTGIDEQAFYHFSLNFLVSYST